ncbi:MAG: hypothetical protein O7F09_04715 [Chloroflexi bacterium]|nr:hypothetical protein [Chloroflexota bacterium]MCZ6891799.1 hypothetical protein [Chloroflexota bacterium]
MSSALLLAVIIGSGRVEFKLSGDVEGVQGSAADLIACGLPGMV